METPFREESIDGGSDSDCMLLLYSVVRQITDELLDKCNTSVTDELARDKERHEN